MVLSAPFLQHRLGRGFFEGPAGHVFDRDCPVCRTKAFGEAGAPSSTDAGRRRGAFSRRRRISVVLLKDRLASGAAQNSHKERPPGRKRLARITIALSMMDEGPPGGEFFRFGRLIKACRQESAW